MLALPEHAPEGVNPSTFALERIRKCKRISAETFEIPASFDPGACFPALVGMLPGAEQEMEVWFDGNVRDYIKSIRWPESCSLTDAGKGAVLLSGRLAASDELIHWICGFGNLAEVKSPPSLRETVISHLKQTLSRYVQDV
jgi:predicted DNA-binding transcriptional regulator YafY